MLGTFLKIASTQPAEVLAHAGFDFVVIDEEHAPISRETTDRILLACRAWGLAGVVRVRGPGDILSALDCGADGVLVPHVASADDARRIVSLCRYRGGSRGYSPTTRAGGFGGLGMDTQLTREDGRVAVIAMIEDAVAVQDIDAILAVAGLDAIFIGRGDLAVSAGGGGVAAATAHVMAAARRAGVTVSLMPADPAEAEELAAGGASLFITGSDQGFIRAAALAARDRFAPLLRGNTTGGPEVEL